MVIRVSPTIELIAGHKKKKIKKQANEESRLRGELVLRGKRKEGISYEVHHVCPVFRLVKVQGQSK